MQILPQPFRLGDQDFVALWPQHLHHFPSNVSRTELEQLFKGHHLAETLLVTVIFAGDKRTVTSEWLLLVIERYSCADDVFQRGFLEGVLFTYSGADSLEVATEARNYLEAQGTKVIQSRHVSSLNEQPIPGPYLYSNGSLHPVWKLYEDVNGAFLETLVPGPTCEPFKLQIAGASPQSLSVAVPSRLQSEAMHTEHSRGALEGWRIAVKDNFHIKGIRTSACNRAYYELYPPASKTAACIQSLYDAGAVIVGKTKLASFAATEEPVECIDWQAPWNPRADGYQSPAGSSSGSGAAIAAYPWLDISIGSDTSGSGRRPGHWNGCFAMRPTHGLLPHDGFIPSFSRFDVPTFFGRDLEKCKRFAEEWYGKKLPAALEKASTTHAIIYSVDYMSTISNTEQVAIVDQFVADLEASLGVKREKISFEKVWSSNPPPEAEGSTLREYMQDASRNSFFHDDYHNFDQFREDYRRKYSKEPYISPPVRWQWELSSKITMEERNVAVERLNVYRKWFSSVVMREKERDALVIIPIEEISPRYRDEASSGHFNPVGVPNLFLSPILGAPELTVPVGECSYMSKVSGKIEHLPIAVSIIASPGQDIRLFDVALDCLIKAGRPTHVLAGKMLIPSSAKCQL